MITRTSALLNPKIGGDELNDNRARVLIALCKKKMLIDDIAMALNCSESVVRSLLVRPFRRFGTDGKNYVAAIGPNTLEVLPLSKRAGAHKALSKPERFSLKARRTVWRAWRYATSSSDRASARGGPNGAAAD